MAARRINSVSEVCSVLFQLDSKTEHPSEKCEWVTILLRSSQDGGRLKVNLESSGTEGASRLRPMLLGRVGVAKSRTFDMREGRNVTLSFPSQ